MAEEKIFADGFSFKRNENAPDFVVGRVSIKIEDAVAFMRQHEKNGWVNLDVKQARSGNYYMELDTFEPKSKSNDQPKSKPSKAPAPAPAEDDDDIPF
jgi:hypothetical protein